MPRDDFHIRYGSESQVHEFLSRNPARIMSWTEAIIQLIPSIIPPNYASFMSTSSSFSALSSSASSTSTSTKSPARREPSTLHDDSLTFLTPTLR